VLQVDHIQPAAKGGLGELLNLITACFDCNAGKSDVELADDSAVQRQRKQL
jgi:5-methylcytosine-specific restriction endonuclease McrA